MKEGWTYKKLGEVCEIYNGNSINADFKKKHFFGATGGLPFIATKDVSTNGSIDYDNGVRIPNYDEYKVAPANSVFVCAEGGSAGKKFAFVEQDVCFGNKLFCLNPKHNFLMGKYIYYFVQSDVFKDQFYALLSGLIGGVSAKKFQQIEIPVSSIDEQRSIISRLDAAFAHIDSLKANAEKQLAEARQLFQAELAECMRPKEGWEEKMLKEIGLTQTGSTPSKADPKNYGDYIPFIRPSEIDVDGCGNIEYDSEMKLSEQGLNNGRLFKKHSILMVCIGATISKVGYCTEDVSCNQQINILTPKDGYDYKFVYYAMRNKDFKDRVIKEGTSAQATLPIINKSKWEQLSLFVPHFTDQQTIASRLDALSANIKKLEDVQRKTLAECDALKQAMLREVFE
ncbi:MAG: restriction endonuclease subunit S [Bacteroidales bacterium]|nr:restriction endonuclease subunit S [Bacteroidales bacterium]